MTNLLLRRFGALAPVVLALSSPSFAAPAAKKPPVKPKAKPLPKPGIKHTPQMAGAVGRFGELYALKSGWTFQILSARFSYDAFDDYNQLFPATDQKLLVLQVAIKNNTPDDLFFNWNDHQFQIQDSNNQVYNGGYYRLSSAGSKEFSPSLKPGQGAGQDPKNRLEVAVPVADSAQITKIILRQGRKGVTEDVMRFFVAGTQGGDPKNIVTPEVMANGAVPLKIGTFCPSRYYQFRINGVTFQPGPIAGIEAPENRRFAVMNLTVRNATSIPQSTYDFIGNWFAKLVITDADGENYVPSNEIGLLKGSSDEQTSGDFAPGQEKTLRLVFPVPANGTFKTLSFGATDSKQWIFDASSWK